MDELAQELAKVEEALSHAEADLHEARDHTAHITELAHNAIIEEHEQEHEHEQNEIKPTETQPSAESIVENAFKLFGNDISKLNEFFKDAVGKLPIPVLVKLSKDEATGKVTVKLHYDCQESDCKSHDVAKVIDSDHVEQWVKLALAQAFANKQIAQAEFVQIIDGLYEDAPRNYALNVIQAITAPILTTAEQDSLIENLRDSHFFDYFNFRDGKHVCQHCIAEKAVDKSITKSEPVTAPLVVDTTPIKTSMSSDSLSEPETTRSPRVQSFGEKEPSKVMLSGILEKLSGNKPTIAIFQSRFFKLENDVLSWAAKEKDHVKNSILVKDIKAIIGIPQDQFNHPFIFRVDTASKQYYLKAESQEDREKWVNAIAAASNIVPDQPIPEKKRSTSTNGTPTAVSPTQTTRSSIMSSMFNKMSSNKS